MPPRKLRVSEEVVRLLMLLVEKWRRANHRPAIFEDTVHFVKHGNRVREMLQDLIQHNGIESACRYGNI